MSLPVFLWKSLPKSGKPAEKGRETKSRRLEISTQMGEIAEKGRDSRCRRSEISTQIGETSRKG